MRHCCYADAKIRFFEESRKTRNIFLCGKFAAERNFAYLCPQIKKES